MPFFGIYLIKAYAMKFVNVFFFRLGQFMRHMMAFSPHKNVWAVGNHSVEWFIQGPISI